MEIKTITLTPGDISTKTANFSNYDDTEIKLRITGLENNVDELGDENVIIAGKVSNLEENEENWATKNDIQNVNNRVNALEDVPVGISQYEMDELFPIE